MNTIIAFSLMLITLIVFAYFGFKYASLSNMDSDKFLSARGTQNWVKIGLSLFASGMGIWVFFGPSEVGYYGGFWDVLGYAVACSAPFYILYKVSHVTWEFLLLLTANNQHVYIYVFNVARCRKKEKKHDFILYFFVNKSYALRLHIRAFRDVCHNFV